MKLVINISILLLFVFTLKTFAQPGRTCVLDYNPFEIKELGFIYSFGYNAGYSSGLLEKRINSDFIFIGKVTSKVSKRIYEIEGINESYFETVKVNLDRSIAGKIKAKYINLTVKDNCYGETIGKVVAGNRYIFLQTN